MEILVADTSVLMYLKRGCFLEGCLDLPMEFAVPDLLYLNEIAGRRGASERGDTLLTLGLRVEELNGDEVAGPLEYQRQQTTLSLTDAAALSLAVNRKWILLSEDSALSSLARSEGIVCRGVLWVLDQLFITNITRPEELVSGIQSIRNHPRCRLTRREIKRRIESYSSRTRVHHSNSLEYMPHFDKAHVHGNNGSR